MRLGAQPRSEHRHETLAALALRPESRVSLLRVHSWLAPVRDLARHEALDLSSQSIADDDAALLARVLERRTAPLRALDLR
ncbi:MAG: hypothetical protein VXY93_16565, partial [Pseudomonadota bacterium]|nr:hypothetical protein [Pseudomonadota bacterium]